MAFIPLCSRTETTERTSLFFLNEECLEFGQLVHYDTVMIAKKPFIFYITYYDLFTLSNVL